ETRVHPRTHRHRKADASGALVLASLGPRCRLAAPIRDLRSPVRAGCGCGNAAENRPRRANVLVAIGILIGLIVGGTFAVIGAGVTEKSRLGQARRLRKQILDDANREAESLRREAEIGAREDAVRLRAEIDAEVSEHRARIVKVEERVLA